MFVRIVFSKLYSILICCQCRVEQNFYFLFCCSVDDIDICLSIYLSNSTCFTQNCVSGSLYHIKIIDFFNTAIIENKLFWQPMHYHYHVYPICIRNVNVKLSLSTFILVELYIFIMRYHEHFSRDHLQNPLCCFLCYCITSNSVIVY